MQLPFPSLSLTLPPLLSPCLPPVTLPPLPCLFLPCPALPRHAPPRPALPCHALPFLHSHILPSPPLPSAAFSSPSPHLACYPFLLPFLSPFLLSLSHFPLPCPPPPALVSCRSPGPALSCEVARRLYRTLESRLQVLSSLNPSRVERACSMQP